MILPWALGDVDLGANVLEVGPGYGATSDVLGASSAKPSGEIVNGDATALTFAELQDRPFAEVARVATRCGAGGRRQPRQRRLAAAHDGGTYNPVDPAKLRRRSRER